MLEEIGWYQRNLFETAVARLRSGPEWGRPLLVYRGASKNLLRRQLFSARDLDHFDEYLFARLFYFGEKARHFSLDDDEAVVRRNWLRSVTDVSPKTFEWLFDQLHRIVRYRYRRVRAFCSENPTLAAYFSERSHRRDFVRRVALVSRPMRALIRDYYLYLLHTYGRKGVHAQTMLISASLELRQASKFKDRADENVVLYLFVPRGNSRFTVSSFTRPPKCLRMIGLPQYSPNTGLYAEQQEIALRGAVFPQRILGASDRTSGHFIVNPHLLQMSPGQLKEMPRAGIPINQDDFDLLVRETGYLGYAHATPEGRFSALGRRREK
ncbi:MAG TPA: hypothetical protein VFQ45_13940 [Longimicrobium sp.]|nr:hypothetical protein [Longimicrobium sp.]